MTTLSNSEFADLARHGKVSFRIFCEKHGLPFHFPDVEVPKPEELNKEFALFIKALDLFNKENRNTVYVMNGKPVVFSYSGGGLDIDYEAYDAKTALQKYLQLREKQSIFEKKEIYYISVLIIIGLSSLLIKGATLPILLTSAVLGLFGNLIQNQKKYKEQQKFENDIIKLRTEIIILQKKGTGYGGDR